MWFFCLILVWLRLVLNKFQILSELKNIYDIQQFIFVLLYIPKTNKRTENPCHYRGKAQQHPKEEEKDSWKVKKPLMVSGLCLVPTNMTTFPLNNVLPNWLQRRSVLKSSSSMGDFPRETDPRLRRHSTESKSDLQTFLLFSFKFCQQFSETLHTNLLWFKEYDWVFY